jgi:lysophospholipase L1-like esterase
LDYIFIMLGTNDIKNKFNKNSAEEIVRCFIGYRGVIENFNSNWEVDFNPKIILVAPPIINEEHLPEHYKADFEDRKSLSEKLSTVYLSFVSKNKSSNFYFIDASQIKVSKGDGVHLDIDQNKELAQLYANFIKQYEK